jgi:hypothetical protein
MKQPALIHSNEVRLSMGFGCGPGLICPRCGSDYLHSGRVSVFDRGEDEAVTHLTVVENGLSATHLVKSGIENPSDRRHGIAIAFECEECSGLLELTLSQHKGNTYLGWRYAPSRPQSPEFTTEAIGQMMRAEDLDFAHALERLVRQRGLL